MLRAMDEQQRLSERVRYKQGPAGLNNGPPRSENKAGAGEEGRLQAQGCGSSPQSPGRGEGEQGVGNCKPSCLK